MSIGCAIVASDTASVREVINDGQQGLLVDFFDIQEMVGAIDRVLDDAALRQRLGMEARQKACESYDIKSQCLPQQVRLLESLVNGTTRKPIMLKSPLAMRSD